MGKYKTYRRPYHRQPTRVMLTPASPLSIISEALDRQGISYTDAELTDFADWLIPELWQQYKKYRYMQRNAAEAELNSLTLRLDNGTMGKPYKEQTLYLPEGAACDYEICGLEDIGLSCTKTDDSTYTVKGIPTRVGSFKIAVKCRYQGFKPSEQFLTRNINIEINPDPRSLWRNIPSNENAIYHKPDTAKEFIKVADTDEHHKDIVAASSRGRSHAQEGKPRDDHFKIYHSAQSGWYIMAVADGAGSAKYSRKGSEVACKTVVEFLKDKLLDNTAFEAAIANYHRAKHGQLNESAARKVVGDCVYSLVGNAAYLAHKEIAETSRLCDNTRTKDFATTLMLAICKKFDFGWFIGTFWVGDGAICLYDKDSHTFSLLGVPDEGEFSGQTRFLTMPEIFSDASALYKRLRFDIKDDFTALMLMTDGVSDPMFGTEANLNSIDKWDEFWGTLKQGFPQDNIPGVDLRETNDHIQDQLLEWLNFWKAGEHDDRTIAILF